MGKRDYDKGEDDPTNEANGNTDNGSEHSTKSAMMCAKNCANVETHSSTDNPE